MCLSFRDSTSGYMQASKKGNAESEMYLGSNISLTPVCVGQLCDTEVFGRWYATCYTIVSIG